MLARLVAQREMIEQGVDADVDGQRPDRPTVRLDTTGDPIFCTLWTYTGLPAISLPMLLGSNEMPVGVQLVGPKGQDGRLLRTARWLVEAVEA